MTNYPVDVTGIQQGDTIVCTSTSPVAFGVGPATVQSVSLVLPGQTTADLPPSPADTSTVTVRVGSGSNEHQEPLRFNASDALWIGPPYVLTSQGDSWAMDMGSYTKAQRTVFQRLNDPVPFGVPFALLSGSHDFTAANFDVGTNTGVVTVDDTTDSGNHSAPFAATSAGSYLRCRNMLISYTAKTSTTFTGCAVVQGARTVVEDTEYVSQGRDGGFGFNNITIPFAGEMFAAGFRLQESMVGLMNSAPDGKRFSVGAYWYQYNVGDGIMPNSIPPSGGMGVGNVLTSNEVAIPGQGHGERNFFMTETLDVSSNPAWLDWALANPTKRFLVPKIVGKHEAGVILSGSVLDFKLAVRWVADGV